MRYLLALILPPFAILSCGKVVSFVFNLIVFVLAWVFVVGGLFLAVIPFFGFGAIVPLPIAVALWVIAALHAVLVVSAHANDLRQRASGGKPVPPSPAFDLLLLVLVCACIGYRYFFPTKPADKDDGKVVVNRTEAERASAERQRADRQTATPAPVVQPPPPAALPAADSLDAQKRAIAAFPALGVAGSPLNREFVARHNRYKTDKPEIFTDPEWPLKLARECAQDAPGGKP